MRNRYRIYDGEAIIILNSPKYGKLETVVDLHGLEKAKAFVGSWYPIYNRSTNSFYVEGQILKKNKKRISISLHRFILDAPAHMQVDHKNHDTLDNRLVNLRLCSHAENGRNKRKRKGGSSIYKGVRWSKAKQKYQAQIKLNNKTIHLGTYQCELEAAKAYNIAAFKYHGEFAKINEIN